MSKTIYIGEKVKKLTNQEKHLVCSCINRSDTEGHPGADPEGLEFYSLSFVLDCLKSAQHSTTLNEMGTDMCHDIYEKLIR